MRRASLLLTVLLALTGCASPAGGGRELELEGRITAVASSGSDRGWVIDTGEGMLALALTAAPPLDTRGVIAAVPDGVELPDDLAGAVTALSEYGSRTGEPLVVVDFLH